MKYVKSGWEHEEVFFGGRSLCRQPGTSCRPVVAAREFVVDSPIKSVREAYLSSLADRVPPAAPPRLALIELGFAAMRYADLSLAFDRVADRGRGPVGRAQSLIYGIIVESFGEAERALNRAARAYASACKA